MLANRLQIAANGIWRRVGGRFFAFALAIGFSVGAGCHRPRPNVTLPKVPAGLVLQERRFEQKTFWEPHYHAEPEYLQVETERRTI